MRQTFIVLELLLLISLLGSPATSWTDDKSPCPKNSTCPTQGWSDEERYKFYHTTQGSRLIPYQWLLALEEPESTEKLLSDAVTDRYRFVVDPEAQDHLPVGFVKECDEDITLDKECNGKENVWVGLTCAACHTSQIDYQDKHIRIDGGASMADFMGYLEHLSDALTKTQKPPRHDSSKFDRFARKVFEEEASDKEKDGLRKQMQTYTTDLNALTTSGEGSRNATAVKYGFARVDAFGLLTNEIVMKGLGVAENRREPNAPVSYPPLWYRTQMEWVQWNGSVGIPMARNIGEALGVFSLAPPGGHSLLTQKKISLLDTVKEKGEKVIEETAAKVPGVSSFIQSDFSQSTVRVGNLHRIEEVIETLQSPDWRALQFFPEIDETRLGEGKKHYNDFCVGCHPAHEKNSPGKLIPIWMSDYKKVGTDETMVLNFACRKAMLAAGSLGNILSHTTGSVRSLKDVFNKGFFDFLRDPKLEKDLQDGSLSDEKLFRLFMRAGLDKEGSEKIADSDACQKHTNSMSQNPDGEPTGAVVAAIGGVILADKLHDEKAKEKTWEYTRSKYTGHRTLIKKQSCVTCYKADPLNGIWATAPYLHNGSVPNLNELLLPAECTEPQQPGKDCRSKKFCVGSREFDTENVGFVKECTEPFFFEFDTAEKGNSNKGHNYGTKLEPNQRKELIEYLKTL